MSIRATCPNGHELRIKSHWAGRRGRCPVCDASMEVPNEPITDDQALNWIGEYTPPEYLERAHAAYSAPSSLPSNSQAPQVISAVFMVD